MKIYIISPNPINGGTKTANLAIADILAINHSVILNDEYYSDAEWNHSFELDKYPLHIKIGNKESIKHILSYQPDIIFWATNTVAIYYLSAINKFKKLGIRQIMLFHSLNLLQSYKGRIIEHLIAIASYRMDFLIFVSEFTRKSWNKYLFVKLKSKNQEIIYNPNITPINNTTRKKNETTNVVFVGRLSIEKQPELFCPLAENDKKRKYIVWGNGPLENTLKEKYGDSVEFKGFSANHNDIYNGVDILVMTSKFENCPMVILECESRGIVPICPKVGGIPEIIGHDSLLYDDFSPGAIKNTISMIEDNYERYSSIVLKNAKEFRAEILQKRWESILQMN